ncbi:MAG: hypothetical protein Q4P15_11535, partial [Propionibacteriaceae bacterium]|nr:hypothetical protein [Propionibacteriaceae bacterium]
MSITRTAERVETFHGTSDGTFGVTLVDGLVSTGLLVCPVQFWHGDGSELIRVVSEIPLPYSSFRITPDRGHSSV